MNDKSGGKNPRQARFALITVGKKTARFYPRRKRAGRYITAGSVFHETLVTMTVKVARSKYYPRVLAHCDPLRERKRKGGFLTRRVTFLAGCISVTPL